MGRASLNVSPALNFHPCWVLIAKAGFLIINSFSNGTSYCASRGKGAVSGIASNNCVISLTLKSVPKGQALTQLASHSSLDHCSMGNVSVTCVTLLYTLVFLHRASTHPLGLSLFFCPGGENVCFCLPCSIWDVGSVLPVHIAEHLGGYAYHHTTPCTINQPHHPLHYQSTTSTCSQGTGDPGWWTGLYYHSQPPLSHFLQ